MTIKGWMETIQTPESLLGQSAFLFSRKADPETDSPVQQAFVSHEYLAVSAIEDYRKHGWVTADTEIETITEDNIEKFQLPDRYSLNAYLIWLASVREYVEKKTSEDKILQSANAILLSRGHVVEHLGYELQTGWVDITSAPYAEPPIHQAIPHGANAK